MILTVTSYKGGVGKTTSAVHLAACLSALASTALIDADPTKNATAWYRRGVDAGVRPFPFAVGPSEATPRLSRSCEHLVFDSGQKPSEEDLQAAAEHSDLIIIPAVPAALDVDGLYQTVMALKKIGSTKFKVLLTRVEPHASREAAELRELLAGEGAPVFWTSIPELKAYTRAAERGEVASAHVDRVNGKRAWNAYAAVGEELGL